MKVLFEAENRFKYSSNQKILLEAILVELSRVNTEVLDLSEILSEIKAVKKKSLTEPSAPAEIKSPSGITDQNLNDTVKEEKKAEVKSITEAPQSIPVNNDKTDKPKNSSEIISKLKELFDTEEYKIN